MPRLAALDALRGLTILLMLLVNNVALDTATPDQLTHAAWGGVNLADLIFPWFLFCMGASIPLSASSRATGKVNLSRYFLRVSQRSLVLFGLGLFLTSSLAHRPIFALDVLQLIALAYWLAAVLYTLPGWTRGLLAGVLLLSYWMAARYLPVPGIGTGVFELDRNLLLHLNKTYLAPLGLRGLVSVVPTAVLALIGGLVMGWLRQGIRSFVNTDRLWNGLLLIGTILLAIGLFWSRELPFSKTYWTPSYVLLSAGLATAILGVFYFMFDITRFRALAYLLVVPGSNALFAYIAPILFKVWILQGWQLGTISIQQAWQSALVTRYGSIPGGWIYTLSYILLWWIVLWLLYLKRIFLRV